MNQSQLTDLFVALGEAFADVQADDETVRKAYLENPWFTPDNQLMALNYWAQTLKKPVIEDWLSHYSFSSHPMNVGIVMAGNLPLVGLHDLLCVVLSGHKAWVKPSSEDRVWMQWVIAFLNKHAGKDYKPAELMEHLKGCEALIATGSNNTARYFEYYFRSVPRIIRKNRSSIAVLTGSETPDELELLGKDIFSYFGLGCRNPSKLLVPEGYYFDGFFEALQKYESVSQHHKFHSNYVYHKAIFLMNLEPHFDNGFLLVKPDQNLHAPLGCLFYTNYRDRGEVVEYIDSCRDQIQIIIGDRRFLPESIAFGASQNPSISAYADNVDTLAFLNTL